MKLSNKIGFRFAAFSIIGIFALAVFEYIVGGINRIVGAQLLYLVLGSTVMIALLMYYIQKFIVGPVVYLSQVSKVIAEGKLDKRAEIKSNDEIGELAKIFNMMADQQEISLETAKDQRNLYEGLLSNIGDGVFAIDRGFRIIMWNKAAENITGWTKAEAMGKPFNEIVRFIRERDRSENYIFIEEAILKGQVKSMEL